MTRTGPFTTVAKVEPERSLQGERLTYKLEQEAGGVLLTLSDGTKLRVLPLVISVEKIPHFDPERKPNYHLEGGLVLQLVPSEDGGPENK